jgi:SPP1 family predicted phage head-tail adaptor
MRAGTMRHRVVLQSLTTGETAGDGGYSETWADTATVWADVQPASASATEAVLGAAERAPITHTVRMRYRSGVTPRNRIKLGTRYLYVTGLQNIGEIDRELVLACEERA